LRVLKNIGDLVWLSISRRLRIEKILVKVGVVVFIIDENLLVLFADFLLELFEEFFAGFFSSQALLGFIRGFFHNYLLYFLL